MDKYFDDFEIGDQFAAPGYTLSEGQILDFALTYDPQPFHIDAEAAAKSPYGGIIASGFQTVSLCFRMMIQTRVFESVSMGGPGIDEMRFHAPVRAGDTITTQVEVFDKIPSNSKPDRGVLKLRVSGYNQRDEKVLSYIVIMIGRCRPV